MRIEYDKTLHLAAGALIGLVVAAGCGPYWGLGAGIAAGVAKEIWDRLVNAYLARRKQLPRHAVDYADAAWTWAGAAVGVLLSAALL